jgi:4-hydroxythreonine-4-phosphate dehydrogenase
LNATIKRLGLDKKLSTRTVAKPAQCGLDAEIICVLNRWKALPVDLPPGQLSGHAGRAAYEYLCHAIDDAQAGRLRAIVTAPLNKKAMQAGGIDYPGHTEILAERTRTPHYAMMLVNQELRVILTTIHVALAQVSKLITLDAELATIRLAQRACLQAGVAAPRIAVAGLNPHAGEQGRFGQEEIQVIGPAIELARAEGIDATGPWPGDTIFMRARQGEFDIVVAQYHDQGLIPVKYLGVDNGINVTIGLPFVRTSVDHGTAFDIAGQGIADPGSLRAAYDLALSMTPTR